MFEAVISTLEGKLQRIDNLDKAVEHMMRRVESLDNKVGDNILKTDAIMTRLGDLNTKLTDDDVMVRDKFSRSSSTSLNNKLSSLDQKVSGIDTKLVKLKNQIDSNFLSVDDINAEASEKRPIHNMNVAEITRAMNSEVMSHVTKDLDQLRKTTEAIDKKLQFHVNLVSQNVGKMLNLVQDVHDAVVDQTTNFAHNASSTTMPPFLKSSKIDSLVHQVKPILSVSEKMDEVWNVVRGTKSSVDDLLPKSDKLLTQTQRQERAIGQIHQDLRTKTNLIIENLDMVEKRLKKQEDDVTILSQRPLAADLLIDPTIDRLVEYNQNRYSIVEDATEQITSTLSPSTINSLTSTSAPLTTSSSTTQGTINSIINANLTTGAAVKPISRKGGIIFPSVKNKPSKLNTTFVSESSLGIKDIKVSKHDLHKAFVSVTIRFKKH